MNNRLTARVEAKNLVNAKANEVESKLREIFLPYVGKKILKVDGSLVSEIGEKLAQFNYPAQNEFRFWREKLNYSLVFTLSMSVNIKDHGSHESAEAKINIGQIDGQILKEINELVYILPTNYSAASIEHARARARELDRQLSVVRSEYTCFGENDYAKVQAE